MITYNYGFEITVLNEKEISIRSVMRIDPQMKTIPAWLINNFSKNFMLFLLKRMMKLGNNMKGTVFEKRIKENENHPFYKHLRATLTEYYAQKGMVFEVKI